MKKNKPYNKKFLTEIVRKLSTDKRISKIFLLGSYGHKGKPTIFSDFDLWIVLSEETGLNSFKNELEIIFNKFGRLHGIYESTAHHFFIVYKEYPQIDLNLTSSATYYNLTNLKNIKVLFSSTFIKKHKIKEEPLINIRRNLLNGFITLERSMSKYIKRDYFVIPRFLENIRMNTILPFLSFLNKNRDINVANLKLNGLSKKQKLLLINTFAKPEKNSCLSAIENMSQLLFLIAKEVNVSDFDLIGNKIKNYISYEKKR